MPDPNKGEILEETPSPPSSVVVPVCDRGAFSITNADKDEDE